MANENCLFCNIREATPLRIVAENEHAYAIRDGFPVTVGHTLIIPKRHAIDYFSLNSVELEAVNLLLAQQREQLLSCDKSIAGFNVGMNCGEAAGQTIFHCHVHLIPRRAGDVPEPKGGVRHVIPGKGAY
jgi:diadenosine tetraphosphate (Ap4A) HIT family hydrolase